MNTTLKNLIKLQELMQQGEDGGRSIELDKQIERLRNKLPKAILGRFDHLSERRRFPVVKISETGACGNCHLKLTPGDTLRFRQTQTSEEIVLTCPFCGCFLYSPMTFDESKELTETKP
jgi:predicted  nucleic acid-binding Zn-ribbon protein